MPRISPKRAAIVLLPTLVVASLWWILGRATPAYRNVVLVTIDTLRADHLGSYGYPRATSPFLDSLAEDGVLFENALSAASHTAPSHASMFTSLNPESHAVRLNGAKLPEGIDTLAGSLGRAGFETAAFTSVTFLRLIGAGFDHFDAARRQADGVVDRAVEWLNGPRTGEPVFLWLHFYDVHQYHDLSGPHRKFNARIRASMNESPGEYSRYLQDAEMLDSMTSRLRRMHLSYDSRIALVDAEIERFFDSEAVQGLEGETLWVVTADHGEGLGNHGYLGHGQNLYREQLRVPLIVYPAPAERAGSRVPDLVRLLDLRPTVVDLLDLDDPVGQEQNQGVSLAPYVFELDTQVEIEYAYSQRRPADERRKGPEWNSGLVLAAQTSVSKYIFKESAADEFYDLRSDPMESNNLIDQELPEAERARRWLLTHYRRMHENRPAEPGDIQPEFLDELKALGYVD